MGIVFLVDKASGMLFTIHHCVSGTWMLYILNKYLIIEFAYCCLPLPSRMSLFRKMTSVALVCPPCFHLSLFSSSLSPSSWLRMFSSPIIVKVESIRCLCPQMEFTYFSVMCLITATVFPQHSRWMKCSLGGLCKRKSLPVPRIATFRRNSCGWLSVTWLWW